MSVLGCLSLRIVVVSACCSGDDVEVVCRLFTADWGRCSVGRLSFVVHWVIHVFYVVRGWHVICVSSAATGFSAAVGSFTLVAFAGLGRSGHALLEGAGL